MIDLHTHTHESDGTSSPEELIQAAVDLKLEALGIADHDTFAGYDEAVPLAQAVGLDLVCGIELSTKLRSRQGTRGKSVHILGYFLDAPPAPAFRNWLATLQRSRRDRNARLAERLRSLGIEVTLEEVEQLGRSLAGRPHFAQIMVRKGYVKSIHEAFEVYLGESARAYVEREEPSVAEGIQRILEGGGLPSLAHPVRLSRDGATVEKMIAEMRDAGLRAIEVYHSDHGPREVQQYLAIARRYDLAITGGTDFHGDNKPGISLGTGINGNVSVPRSVLDDLRAGRPQRHVSALTFRMPPAV
ncbi:MAG: PHP domain-containing protein [Rhodospirillales bacterium]